MFAPIAETSNPPISVILSADWGSLPDNVTSAVKSCKDAAKGVKIQVILAVLTNFIKMVGVRRRCVRNRDAGHHKCIRLITNIIPVSIREHQLRGILLAPR